MHHTLDPYYAEAGFARDADCDSRIDLGQPDPSLRWFFAVWIGGVLLVSGCLALVTGLAG